MTQQTLPKAANFGDIALNQGNNMELDALLLRIGPIERLGKNNTPCQKCILQDASGNQDEATIWQGRTATALADINLNKWLTFSLSASKYRGKDQYSGFWQMEAPVITQPPQVSPQNQAIYDKAAQVAAQPLQATNKPPDWDAIAEGKVRHGVVCAFIQGGKFDVDIAVVDYWVRYIMDGQVQAPEPISQETCPQCRLLRVDCTCPTEQFVR